MKLVSHHIPWFWVNFSLPIFCISVKFPGQNDKYRLFPKQAFDTEELERIPLLFSAKISHSTYLFKESGKVFYIVAIDNGAVFIKQSGKEKKGEKMNGEEKKGERCYHIHDQFVTDIKPLSDSRLVTCSEDGKIKLWKNFASESDALELRQIGEFSGYGPVITCLDVDDDDKIAVGDSAGNIFFLTIF